VKLVVLGQSPLLDRCFARVRFEPNLSNSEPNAPALLTILQGKKGRVSTAFHDSTGKKNIQTTDSGTEDDAQKDRRSDTFVTMPRFTGSHMSAITPELSFSGATAKNLQKKRVTTRSEVAMLF
jgi:hypothetical protein